MPHDTAQSTGLRIGHVGRRWHLEVPIGPLPATVTHTGSLFGGLFIMVFALAWGGLPTAGMISNGLPDLGQPENWLFLLFPALAVGIFLYGLSLLVWRKTITLDDLFVRVEERRLFGTEAWQEQRTAYRGVLSHSRRVSTKNSSYILYMIDLAHPDRRRNISLYSSRSDRAWRAKWEDYARWLELPALQEGSDGLVARDIEDLDKPVAELLREGKLEVDYDLLQERAEGLAVDIEGDSVVVTRTGPELAWWGALIMLAFPLVFVYVGLFLEDTPPLVGWFFGGIGLLFEAALLAAVVWDRISRKRLRIGPREVTVNAVGPNGETKGKSMPVGAIEEVRVGHRKGENSAVKLLIVGDRERLSFGQRLPRASLDFLEHLVLAKIAKHHDDGGG
jgi:hypothetical protein